MKRSFIAIMFIFSFISASAQDSLAVLRVQTFIRDRFDKYMVDYVWQHAVVVPVDQNYFSDHKKETYLYSDLKGGGTKNGLRIGDTILVFNGQPFYSIKQGMYMMPFVEEKTVKHKRAKREPKSPEEKQRNQETFVRILGTVAPGVINKVGKGSVVYQSSNMIY